MTQERVPLVAEDAVDLADDDEDEEEAPANHPEPLPEDVRDGEASVFE